MWRKNLVSVILIVLLSVSMGYLLTIREESFMHHDEMTLIIEIETELETTSREIVLEMDSILIEELEEYFIIDYMTLDGFGIYLTRIDVLEASDANNSYIHIEINHLDSMWGISEIMGHLEDQDTLTFSLQFY